MRFLTDENIAISIIKKLRERGHEVKDIKEESLYEISDSQILILANEEKRVIITHDKDFANIIRNPYQDHHGIIIIRSKNQNPNIIWSILNKILNSDILDKMENNIVLLSENRITIYRKK